MVMYLLDVFMCFCDATSNSPLFKTLRLPLYAKWNNVNGTVGQANESAEQTRLTRPQPQRLAEAEGGGGRRYE